MNRLISNSAAIIVFTSFTTSAHANPEPMMSGAIYAALPAFMVWCLIGGILLVMKRELKLLRPGWIAAAITASFLNLLEFAMSCWLIYLVLVVGWYICQRGDRREPNRWLNVFFHSSFLVLVIGIGVGDKYNYWGKHGGFDGWSWWMHDQYPPFLIFYFVFTLFVVVFSRRYQWGRKSVEVSAQTQT